MGKINITYSTLNENKLPEDKLIMQLTEDMEELFKQAFEVEMLAGKRELRVVDNTLLVHYEISVEPEKIKRLSNALTEWGMSIKKNDN